MPEDEGIATTLAGALLQVRAIRGTMPDEKEAVRIYLAVLKELSTQSSETRSWGGQCRRGFDVAERGGRGPLDNHLGRRHRY